MSARLPHSRLGKLFLLLVGLAALLATLLVVIGLPDEVAEIPVPPDSLIAQYLENHGYGDAYLVELPAGRFSTVEELHAAAFECPRVIQQNLEEILCAGNAPGLQYKVSYMLRQQGGPYGQAVAIVATVVHDQTTLGKIYFFVVRPLHRFGVPWLVRRMVKRAAAA